MEKTWTFTQSHFAGGGSGGVCSALCARWAKMMLRAQKDYQFVPSITEADRNMYFQKANVPGKIAAVQTRFDQQQTRNKSDLAKVRAANSVSRILGNNIPNFDGLNLTIAIHQSLAIIGSNVDEAIEEVLTANKLRAVEDNQSAGFTSYWDGCSTGGCYIFFSSKLGHATAGYVTGGIRWQDYYFFDPNAGEFKAEGTQELHNLMTQFKTQYKQEGSARRVRVVTR